MMLLSVVLTRIQENPADLLEHTQSNLLQFIWLQVKKYEKTLSDWEAEQHDLYGKHEWLMFYSIPKLMLLFQNLNDSSVTGVLKETLFLFKHDLSSGAVVEKVIQVCTLPY